MVDEIPPSLSGKSAEAIRVELKAVHARLTALIRAAVRDGCEKERKAVAVEDFTETENQNQEPEPTP